MKMYLSVILGLVFTQLCPVFQDVVNAQESPTVECNLNNSVCVPEEDLRVFSELAFYHNCRYENSPTITSDPITIAVDRQGRVYGSGTGTKPYTLKMHWCNYDLEATSEVTLQVAQYVEPDWGFRLRFKAGLGFLGADLVNGTTLDKAVDGGLLVEPFYFHWIAINAYLGVRSIGAGLSFDLTNNFGIYTGYSITWGSWRSNPLLSIFFAF